MNGQTIIGKYLPMNKIILSIVCLQLLCVSTLLGQDTSMVSITGFRTLFTSGGYHMTYGSYNLAVPVFLELEKLAPDNANIQYKIGYSYLRSADDKSVAILTAFLR